LKFFQRNIKSLIPFRISRFLPHFLVSGDILFLAGSFLGAVYLQGNSPDGLLEKPAYYGFFIFSILSWLTCVLFLKSYTIKRINSFDRVAKNTIETMLYHVFLVSVYIVATEAYFIPRDYLLAFYSLYIPCLFVWRFGVHYLLGFFRRLGLNHRNVVIIGYNPYGLSLRKYFEQNPELGFRFKGFFDHWPHRSDSIVGKFQRSMEDFLRKESIDEVYVCQSYLKHRYFRHLVKFTESNFLKIKLLPDVKGLVFDDLELEFYSDLPIVSFRREPLQNELNAALKRSFDVAFSFLILVGICSWLFPLIALLIKLDSKGPVFFIQKRSGRAGKDFLCLKFRTMVVNEEADIRQATRNDNRITRFGKFLRESNIDELPQFFNVLLGDMSVVGPRPHMIKHTEEYSKTISNYMLRHLIKPGVTGLAQAKGYRGQTNDDFSMRNRVRVDILYIERWSFFLDLKVIGLTLLNMVKGQDNAY
jgi:putative colanic acid biosynthesis UDP-glucose lipid carrier transferase